jgi:hypothetical protein
VRLSLSDVVTTADLRETLAETLDDTVRSRLSDDLAEALSQIASRLDAIEARLDDGVAGTGPDR